MFSQNELAYINPQILARIGTVSDKAQPDVVPVGYDFDEQYFFVGGRNNPSTHKYKNVNKGNKRVALVIDALASLDPWRARGIRVFGTADIIEHEEYAGQGKYIRIQPAELWSWGINEA